MRRVVESVVCQVPMKRGDKVVLFVDILGFARLTEEWPRRIIHRRWGSIRGSGTSESHNRLSVFHSVLDQMLIEFSRLTGSLTSMSFSDCAFVLLPNPHLVGEFASELMQHYVKAFCPVRMGLAAGTFWPGRLSSDVIGATSVSRAIFHGTAIVRAHAAENHGGAGMRIFIHESLDNVSGLGPRPILRFPAKKKQVIGELSYLHHKDQYRDVNDTRKVDDEDQRLWTLALALRQSVNKRAPRRVHQHYLQTLAALQAMRRLSGREPFKRSQLPRPL